MMAKDKASTLRTFSDNSEAIRGKIWEVLRIFSTICSGKIKEEVEEIELLKRRNMMILRSA